MLVAKARAPYPQMPCCCLRVECETCAGFIIIDPIFLLRLAARPVGTKSAAEGACVGNCELYHSLYAAHTTNIHPLGNFTAPSRTVVGVDVHADLLKCPSNPVKAAMFLRHYKKSNCRAGFFTTRLVWTVAQRGCFFKEAARIVEDLFLAQFQTGLCATDVEFTLLQAKPGRGLPPPDALGLTSRNGSMPRAIAGAVKTVRWFHGTGAAEIRSVIRGRDHGPVLLLPNCGIEYMHPRLDGVLVWRTSKQGAWKALLIQVTMSPRHTGRHAAQEDFQNKQTFVAWVCLLCMAGVLPNRIGVLFCVAPDAHPYPIQDLCGLRLPQYSMSWTS